MTVSERIRAVLDTHARLTGPAANLGAGDDLYAAGMTSHASVNVMLALEDAFDIDIGYDEIGRVETIRGVVERVRSRVAAKRQARSRASSEAGRRTSSAWLRASLKS